MAEQHASRYAKIDGVDVIAAVDINKDRLHSFQKQHSIKNVYGSLDEALRHHEFDACSVVTPDSSHAAASIQCLEAGMAVLCEKPLSDSLESASDMVSAAARSSKATMVNLSYRSSGALQQARRYIDNGELGEVRHIEASYRQSWLSSDYWGDWKTDDAWLWRLSTEHGSMGVLGDVGIHILDFLCAGSGMDITALQCRLHTFDKAPNNRIGDYTLDANDSCVMNVQLNNGALGVVHMSRYYTGYQNDLNLSIHGDKGAVKVHTGGLAGDRLEVCLGNDMNRQEWKTVRCADQPDTFERFIDALRGNNTVAPDFAEAARLQQYLSLGFESHRSGSWQEVCPL